MRDVSSFDVSSDTDDILDEIVIAPATSEFQKVYSCLHPSKSSPITFCDNTDESIPSTSSNENNHESSATSSVSPSTFSNQLTTDCFNISKNSKSRRMEYSMGSMRTCSNSSSCNPSQDSAFGSMTDGELSIASSSLKMNSFQSMSSPIDESVEDSSEFSSSKKVSIVICASSSGIPIEPPTILVNDKNSIYTTSPAKSIDMAQTFSEKYRVPSFDDMSTKRNVLKNVHKQNFRSLEEERRIDSAFIPIVRPAKSHNHNFDANQTCSINNPEKFKKLTHVSFASKVSTRERHTIWKNSISARGNSMKSNESLHEYLSSDTLSNDIRLTRHEYIYGQNRCKRVNSSSELRSFNRVDSDGRFPIEDTSQIARKSYSERHLLNLIALKQSTINNDCEELDEDEAPVFIQTDQDNVNSGISYSSGYSKISLRNSKAESNSTDSSPSHRSMCKIIGGTDTGYIEDKIPLLDGMEMSPISPVETDEIL